MSSLIVAAMIGLDGAMQAPGGPEEDTGGGFVHGGWVWPYSREEDETMGGVFSRPYDLVLGRRTYDIFAAYWPWMTGDGPDLVTQGSINLVRQLLATDLVDELRLLVFPALLGRGKRLFDDHARPSAFRLAASQTSAAGVLVTRYLRYGDVRTGTHGPA